MAEEQEKSPLTDKNLEVLSSKLNKLVEEKLGNRKFVSTGLFRPGEVDPDILGAWIVRGEPEAQGLERFNYVSLNILKEKYFKQQLNIIYLAEKPIIQTLTFLPLYVQPPEGFENLFDRLREVYKSDPRNKPRPAKPAELKQAIEFLSKVDLDPQYSI